MQRNIHVMSLAAVLMLPGLARALPDSINPAEYATPSVCDIGFKLAGTSCAVDPALSSKQTSCSQSDLLELKAGACVLKSDKSAAAPTCKLLEGYKETLADGKCTYAKSTPVSAVSDYLGDCFTIAVAPPGSGLAAGKRYITTAQGPKSADGIDRELDLVEAGRPINLDSFGIGAGLCRPKPGGDVALKVSAAELARYAAYRTGWAYGGLTMPYKYYPSEKSYVTGVPIGLYAGVRFGETGTATTFAAAFTLGMVSGDTGETKTDAAGVKTFTKTGTTQIPALSAAVGVIFDIFKSREAKPFKIGLFVGKDRVNESETTAYRFNRKKWVAFQIGYDFTDN